MAALFRKGTITKDPQLQQDLERYYQIRAASSRILTIAQNPLQRLEAAKTVLVSHAQLLTCLKLIQREKVADALNINSLNSFSVISKEVPILTGALLRSECAQPGRARLCISNIRIPLFWRDLPADINMQLAINQMFPQSNSTTTNGICLADSKRHFDKNEITDQCDGYSVFCTIEVDSVIRDTRLIFDIKPGTADIEFHDKWIFDNINENFECKIEIYAFPKVTNKSSSMFSRLKFPSTHDPIKKIFEQSDGSHFENMSNQSNYFDLVGRCVATLKDVQNKVCLHTLETGSKLLFSSPTRSIWNSNTNVSNGDDNHLTTSTCDIPLFGNICYRLIAQPHSAKNILKSGLLCIRKLTASPIQDSVQLYQCVLRDRFIWAWSMKAYQPDCNVDEKEQVVLHTSFFEKFFENKENSCISSNGSGLLFTSNDRNNNHDSNRTTGMFYHSYSSRSSNFKMSTNGKELDRKCSSSSSCLSLPIARNDDTQGPDKLLCPNPDLVIPIHSKTHFLDEAPVQRLIESAYFPSTNSHSSINNSNSIHHKNDVIANSAVRINPFPTQPITDRLTDSPVQPFIRNLTKSKSITLDDTSRLSKNAANDRNSNPYDITYMDLMKMPVSIPSSPDVLTRSRSIDQFTHSNPKSLAHLKTFNSFQALNIENINHFSKRDEPNVLDNGCVSPVDPMTTAYLTKLSSFSLECLTKPPVQFINKSGQMCKQKSVDHVALPNCNPSLSNMKMSKKLVYTFRIATYDRGDNDSTLPSTTCLTSPKPPPSIDVYELGFVHNSELSESVEKVNFMEEDTDCHETTQWFTLIKQHIQEQNTWGVDSFFNSISIPRKNISSVKDHSARRSLAITNDHFPMKFGFDDRTEEDLN